MDHEYIEQAARAERLARYVTDKMTVERLLAYAAECRAKIRDNRRPEPTCRARSPSAGIAAFAPAVSGQA